MTSSEAKTLVIYTGGTFGMKDDGEGLTPANRHDVSKELCKIVPLSDNNNYQQQRITDGFGKEMIRLTTKKARAVGKCPITYDVYEFEKLIDSSLMNQKDWMEIAECIKMYYEKYSGFVVVMGTDTMAYASSALSFMLENLSKPVVFTGAQITIFDALSDGPENLLCSLIVSTLKIPEVLLCFNKKAFRGNRVVKTNCVDLDAYTSPNLDPLVTLDTKVIEGEPWSAETGDLRVQKMCEQGQVGLLVVYPGITENQVRNTVQDLDAVVLLTFGSGNIDDKIVEILVYEQSRKKRLYVNVTQCLKGSVTSGYRASKALRDLEAVKCNDMTTEAAFTKLSYVLAKTQTFNDRKMMMMQVIRGEMSVDSEPENRNNENN